MLVTVESGLFPRWGLGHSITKGWAGTLALERSEWACCFSHSPTHTVGHPPAYVQPGNKSDLRYLPLNSSYTTVALGRDQRQEEDSVTIKWTPSDVPGEKTIKFILHKLFQSLEDPS